MRAQTAPFARHRAPHHTTPHHTTTTLPFFLSRNDAGADCAIREASRAMFLDFFRGPAKREEAAGRQGVYESYLFPNVGGSEHTVQVIMLDTRYNRSPLAYGLEVNKGGADRQPHCLLPWTEVCDSPRV